MLPLVGGNWNNAANSGVFEVALTNVASITFNAGGARAVRLLSA